MPLRKCMQEHTHREFKLWIAYLDDEWYRPTRSDHFLMRIAQRVQQIPFQIWGKDSNKITLEHQEVFKKPGDPKEKPEEESAESVKERTLWSKMRWFGIAGLTRKKKKKHGDD